MMSPQFDPSIGNGMKRYYEASITNFLCGSVGSSHICIPNFWHWFGFISDFFILFTNHKSCPKSSIISSPESSANTVTLAQIGILSCSVYSGMNGDTVHSSKVNDTGRNFSPKKMDISMIVNFSV